MIPPISAHNRSWQTKCQQNLPLIIHFNAIEVNQYKLSECNKYICPPPYPPVQAHSPNAQCCFSCSSWPPAKHSRRIRSVRYTSMSSMYGYQYLLELFVRLRRLGLVCTASTLWILAKSKHVKELRRFNKQNYIKPIWFQDVFKISPHLFVIFIVLKTLQQRVALESRLYIASTGNW